MRTYQAGIHAMVNGVDKVYANDHNFVTVIGWQPQMTYTSCDKKFGVHVAYDAPLLAYIKRIYDDSGKRIDFWVLTSDGASYLLDNCIHEFSMPDRLYLSYVRETADVK